MRELPAIATGTYTANAMQLAGIGNAVATDQWTAPQLGQAIERRAQFAPSPTQTVLMKPSKQEIAKMATRRLVQVFIADPDENVPVADCLLHRGEPVLTDATDQELFFEIDIKTILDAHNAKRVKLIDKKVKERTEHLEPAKIRDLKMTVVTIATF